MPLRNGAWNEFPSADVTAEMSQDLGELYRRWRDDQA